MPATLIPASAAVGSTRARATIVLGTKVEPWLTQKLKQLRRVRGQLNYIKQHHCLTEILSSSTSVWSLCSLMLPGYECIHVKAYVVHLDMVSQNELSFKLTTDTVASLIEYHKNLLGIDMIATDHCSTDEDNQLEKLHDDFTTAINNFVFCASATVLEGLEEDGAGELPVTSANEVEYKILGLFQSLMPPPLPSPIGHAPPSLPGSKHGVACVWPSSIDSQVRQEHQKHDQFRQIQEQWEPFPLSSDFSAPTQALYPKANWAAPSMQAPTACLNVQNMRRNSTLLKSPRSTEGITLSPSPSTRVTRCDDSKRELKRHKKRDNGGRSLSLIAMADPSLVSKSPDGDSATEDLGSSDLRKRRRLQPSNQRETSSKLALNEQNTDMHDLKLKQIQVRVEEVELRYQGLQKQVSDLEGFIGEAIGELGRKLLNSRLFKSWDFTNKFQGTQDYR